MSNETKKKPAGPKPWAQRVRRTQAAKARQRKYWTRARWLKHDTLRQAKRTHHPLPHLKSSRLERKRELADSAARSARMRAYHARRRAALAAASGTEPAS